MRQNLKSKEYFELFLQDCEKRTARFYLWFKEGKIASGQEKIVNYEIFQMAYQSTIAKFSMGCSIEEVRNQFKDCISKMQIGWFDDGNNPADKFFFDAYQTALSILSLASLLGIDASYREDVWSMLKRYEKKDFLLDFIFNNGRIDLNTPLQYPESYADLRESIIEYKTNIISSERMILDFLNKKWYKNMSMVFWYNNHKSKHDTHFGYWAFEVAEVVRLLGLNPEAFQKSQYFPIDLFR